MVSQPGVVDPAGYDLITGVQSVEGGKTAVVTFSQPYPAWRELFNDILPAHIVKDVPGGFAAGLARALPVTGGQFRVESIDPQRDEILLARNDRYWGDARQAGPDPVPARRRPGRAGRLDPQRRHPGRPGARRLGGVRAAVRDPRRAHRAHRHAAGHAADAARPTAHARRCAGAQGDSRPARRRSAGRGRRRQRQHRDAGAGAGALAVRPGLRADGAAGDDQRGGAGAAGRRPDTRSNAGGDPASRPTPGTPVRRRRPRTHHQGRRAADAGDRRGGQRSDVGGGGQHRRRPVAQRRHRGVGARPWIRWRSTATRWPTTASTRSSAGIRPAAIWRPRWRRATAAGRWRRRRFRPRRPADAGTLDRRRRTPSAGTDRHARRRRRRRASGAGVRSSSSRRRSNITGICDRSIQPNIDAALAAPRTSAR